LLVHDNTPRRPPAVDVPALLRRAPAASPSGSAGDPPLVPGGGGVGGERASPQTPSAPASPGLKSS
jgi:hypothetical protein